MTSFPGGEANDWPLATVIEEAYRPEVLWSAFGIHGELALRGIFDGEDTLVLHSHSHWGFCPAPGMMDPNDLVDAVDACVLLLDHWNEDPEASGW